MKVKDLLKKLESADPDMEIDLEADLAPQGSPWIYFFERPDGKIVQVTAKEAYTVQFEYNPAWKQIGASDGSKWRDITREIRKKCEELKSEIKQYTANELPVPPALNKRFKVAHMEFVRLNNDGIAAELEAARGHIHRPPRNNMLGTPEGLEAMGQAKHIQKT